MRRTTYLAAAVLATGALGVGVAAVSPALARPGPSGQPAVTTSWGGHGPAGGGMGGWTGDDAGTGVGMAVGRDGECPFAADAASGELTDRQRQTLAAMAEEEKLAHDLYQTFADRYDSALFARTAASEARHLAAVRSILERYGVADPTERRAVGEFASTEVAASYERFLKEGSAGLTAALGVGRQVEQADIEALEEAQAGLAAPDVERVYQNLLRGSRNHLAAFTR